MMRFTTLKACTLTFTSLLLLLNNNSYQEHALDDYIEGNQDDAFINSLNIAGEMEDHQKEGVERNLQVSGCLAKIEKNTLFCRKKCPDTASWGNIKCDSRCTCDKEELVISLKEKNRRFSHRRLRKYCIRHCPDGGKCATRCNCISGSGDPGSRMNCKPENEFKNKNSVKNLCNSCSKSPFRTKCFEKCDCINGCPPKPNKMKWVIFCHKECRFDKNYCQNENCSKRCIC